MLARQALWVPVWKHQPGFVDGFHRFIHNNPISSLNVFAMGLKPEEVKVILEPDALQPNQMVATMMAFPALISSAACDPAHAPSPGTSSPSRELASGFATAVCDSCNSFHVMERLLPRFSPHVSVSLSARCLRPLHEREKVVIVSSIRKMGKRLVFCEADFLVEPAEPVPEEVERRESSIRTVEELRAALMYYERAVSSTHVKSIVSERKSG